MPVRRILNYLAYARRPLAVLYVRRAVHAVADVEHDICLVEAADAHVDKALF